MSEFVATQGITLKELAPIVIAAAAFAVSLLSLGVSALVAFRDRARIKAQSWYWPPSEHCKDGRIRIRIENRGRRDIHIEHLVLDSGQGWRTYLDIDESQVGMTLQGGRSYHKILALADVLMESHEPGDVAFARRIWFEDGIAKRHSPRGSRRHLRLLQNKPRSVDTMVEFVVGSLGR